MMEMVRIAQMEIVRIAKKGNSSAITLIVEKFPFFAIRTISMLFELFLICAIRTISAFQFWFPQSELVLGYVNELLLALTSYHH